MRPGITLQRVLDEVRQYQDNARQGQACVPRGRGFEDGYETGQLSAFTLVLNLIEGDKDELEDTSPPV